MSRSAARLRWWPHQRVQEPVTAAAIFGDATDGQPVLRWGDLARAVVGPIVRVGFGIEVGASPWGSPVVPAGGHRSGWGVVARAGRLPVRVVPPSPGTRSVRLVGHR